MPSEISLLVTEGPLTGSVFKFKSHETSIIGRGLDCYPCLPDDEGHQTVSRKHCKLYFVGEKVKIKDFGSLNGTYVNGINIGRGESMPHDADTVEIDLQNKDLIRVGSTTLKLQFNSDSICAKCSKPIELDDLNHSDSDKERICRTCYVIEQIEQKQALNASNFNKDRSSLKTDESTPSNLADNLKQFGIDEAVKIDGFEIIRLLGQGGMGSVYLAREQATNNLVALKVILPSVIEDENVVNMFLREASLTSTLNHDNIVRLLETNKQGSSIYFTMEYCDGGSVNKLIHQRGGKIPVDESVDIICQALDGLDYAHNAKVKIQLSDGRIKSSDGMLHRDIKPANIFLKGFGSSKVAKIADMGLSKALDTAGL
ncbi:MAG: protein kinase domain-containing protein, partial [Nitrospinota bacterium]